jgi:hypothetical protein
MSPDVRAEVKAILAFGEGATSSASLEEFVPQDPRHFGAQLQVLIGSEGAKYDDSFDVTICTPSWMAECVEAGNWEPFRHGFLRAIPESISPGCGVWFMALWNEQDIRGAVRVICEAFSPGPDWGSVAARIGRVIPWEFDYRYDAHINSHFGEVFPPSH